MSKVAPHNATLRFEPDHDPPRVLKTYHAKYTAEQEAASYRALFSVTASVAGVRTAEVLEVSQADNCITLEYVAGLNLWELVTTQGVGGLKGLQPRLVDMFATAREHGVRFDADPSNMILDEVHDTVVFVDPTCIDLDLDDFAAVVFLWGLIKMSLRNRRIHFTPGILLWFAQFERAYLAHTGGQRRDLRHQMQRYIDVVIGWNREPNAVEGPGTRAFRRAVVIPLYRAVQRLLSRS